MTNPESRPAQSLSSGAPEQITTYSPMVKCEECGQTCLITNSDIATYARQGWPRHCGLTMTFVPAELSRAASPSYQSSPEPEDKPNAFHEELIQTLGPRSRPLSPSIQSSPEMTARELDEESFSNIEEAPSGSPPASEITEALDEFEKQCRNDAHLPPVARNLTRAARSRLETLYREQREEIERLRQPAMCGVCAGTGKPTSGLPCVCDGIGTEQAEMHGLRVECFRLEGDLSSLKEDAERWRALIGSPRVTMLGGARFHQSDWLLAVEFYADEALSGSAKAETIEALTQYADMRRRLSQSRVTKEQK